MPGKMQVKANSEAVKVVVRCRPLSKDEIADKRDVIVDIDTKAMTVQLRKPGTNELTRVHTYDFAFDDKCTQREVYDKVAYPIVQAAIDGFNGTVFAYGQTGTGKSFSMVGVYDQPELRGIIPNAFVHIFDELASNKDPNKNFLVRASYLEIYNEEVRDLLSKNYTKKLELKEHPEKGVYVKDLSAFMVNSFKEIDDVMTAGNKNRQVGSTKMNAESSRSHSIFTITIDSIEKREGDEPYVKVGKLNLVDLAGSERQSKTGAEGDRLQEAVNINKSLSALGNVISALVDAKAKHIPYRDSKLTRLLQDSLGGNSKTVMIATMGPADWNFDETMSTLRYASRAKNIKNKPKINEDPKDAMIRQFQEEIDKLKAQLGEGAGGVVKKKKRRKGAATPKRKVPKKNAEGEIIDGEYTEESDEDAVAETPEYTEEEDFEDLSKAQMEELEKKLAEEKAALEGNLKMEKEEKKRMMAEMRQREELLMEEQRKRDAIAAKLQAMEAKIVVGGENMIDVAEKQARQLELQKAQLEQKKRDEEELNERLKEQEEDLKLKNSHFKDIQEEIEIKTKKLKKLWTRLQATKEDYRELEEEQARDKEDALSEIRVQARELLLCKLIINNFIPDDEFEKIRMRAVWDEMADTYRLQHLNYTGNNIDRMKVDEQPTDHAERFNADAINNLESSMDAMAGSKIPANLMDEEQTDGFSLAGDNMPDVYLCYDPERTGSRQISRSASRQKSSSSRGESGKSKSKAKLKSKHKSTLEAPQEEFPQARGLIKNKRH